MKSMANFYAMGSSFSLACHYSEKRKDLNIEDDISQTLDDLALRQKWGIIRHVRSKE